MKQVLLALLIVGGGLEAGAAEAEKLLYGNDFEKAELNKVPEEFLVHDGGYSVKEEAGNKFLELPGAPLDTFGVLFGPTEKDSITVSARIHGTSKGRRYPTFAVGLNGLSEGAYRLQVSPAKKLLELHKGEKVAAQAPYEWQAGKWTLLKLQVKPEGNGWKVEGKAWTEGSPEPAWILSVETRDEPPAGRASIWGSPYAGTAIRFDDLAVRAAKDKQR